MFKAEIGRKGYEKNMLLHNQVQTLIETNYTSINIDLLYCVRISIKIIDRIVDITVGHICRELPRFVFILYMSYDQFLESLLEVLEVVLY